MQEYIRRYNYIQDYHSALYKIYGKYYPAYPCNYYSIDWENSVYDKEQLLAGSYEKYGIGDLSGFKWKKILLLPVYGVEQIQPQYNADEKGLTLSESETTSVAFSSEYGLKPIEHDFVHFHQEFMSPNEKINFEPIFVVHNVNLATYGSLTHYQCKLKIANISRDKLESQISSHWMFLEFTKTIHRIDTASLMLKLQQKNNSLYDRLKSLYHNPTGFYLQKI